jgi:predicted RNA methylase
LELSERVVLPINRPGIANGIRLKTNVIFTAEIETTGSPWFNPTLILPFDDIEVSENDSLEVELSYGFGAGFSNVNYNVRLLK